MPSPTINPLLSSSVQSFLRGHARVLPLTTDPTSRRLPVFDKLIPLSVDEQLDSGLPSSCTAGVKQAGSSGTVKHTEGFRLGADTRDGLKSSAQGRKTDHQKSNSY